MSVSLPVKYRPTEFKDVCAQENVIKILEKQVELGEYKNCYLFSGPSGCGKTTIARILAYKMNAYKNAAGDICSSEPIEIDAASNNGVDNVRMIIDNAMTRSIDGKYKVFIIDEAHMLTNQSWNALLKTIEETPKYSIFMFCTTEYHKVPETIQNRCQQYFLSRVPVKEIVKRLEDICKAEGFKYDAEGLDSIAKRACGSMRQAIAYLDKCKDLSNDITIDNVDKALGEFSYDTFFELTNALIDKNSASIINVVERLYNNGGDLKVFTEMYIGFVLDLLKYIIFRSYDIISIPKLYESKLAYTINVEGAEKYFDHLLTELLKMKLAIKGDANVKDTIEICLLGM